VSDLEFTGSGDGWLLLRGPEGDTHRLAVDDRVREAVRSATVGPAGKLSPRGIQDRLRHGVAAAAIAEEAGTSVAHVERWAAPILAERAAVVERARATRFSRPSDGAVSGPLGPLVDARLAAVAVQAEWDAWKNEEGSWTVQATHREGSARWRFTGDSLTPLDRAAEQLGWAPRRPHVVPDPPADEAPTEVRPRGRRASLPSWEAIVEGTQPPSSFPT
jgi:hypothetical protein